MMFAKRLKNELRRNNMTQLSLAKKVGISISALRGYFDDGKMPRADNAVAIAQVLGTSVEYLITGNEIEGDMIIHKKAKLAVLEEFRLFINTR